MKFSSYFLTEITEKTLLYYQSPNHYEIGDVISPKSVQKDSPVEAALEQYRKEKCKNKPSRKKCVPCTLVPPENNKDFQTYIVKPIGDTHKTSIEFLANMIREWKDVSQIDKLSLDHYWSPPKETFRGDNKQDIEVLCHSVQVVAISNSKMIKDGKKYQVTSEVIIPGWNPKLHHKKFYRKDTDLLQKEFNKFTKSLKHVELIDKQNGEFDVVIKPGAKIIVNFIRYRKIDETGIANKLSSPGIDYLDISFIGADNFSIDLTRQMNSFDLANFVNSLKVIK